MLRYDRFQAVNFVSHGFLGRVGVARAFADSPGYAGIDHVFTAAIGRTDAEHGIVVGAIEGTDCNSAGTAVVTDTGCYFPTGIGIEIQGVESCQGGCTGTDAVDTIVESINAVAHFTHAVADVGNDVVQLADVYGIRCGCTGSYVMDLVAAHADVVGRNGNGFGRIAAVGNGEAAVIDGRVARYDRGSRYRVAGNRRRRIAGTNGNLIAGCQRLRFYTVKAGELGRQFNVKAVASGIVYNTDVTFGQGAGISTALEVQGVIFTE